MMTLLVLESKLKNIYARYSRWIRIIVKFIIGISITLVVGNTMPYNPMVCDNIMLLSLVLGFLIALTPDSVGIFLASAVVVAQVMYISIIMAVVFLSVVIIYILLFGRFDEGQSLFIVCLLLFWTIDQPYAFPIIIALLGTVAYVPACIIGVLLHYVISGIKEYHLLTMGKVEAPSQIEGLRFIVDYIARNREMLLYMGLFSVVIVLVFILRKRSYNYASYVAIAVGLIVSAVGMIVGDTMLGTKTDIVKLLIAMLVAAILSIIVQFFRMNLNYSGVRMLQFHDDEYYYYVKAIPKIKVEAKDKTIKNIKDLEPEAIDLQDKIEKTLEEDLEAENLKKK
ncbi:hypothetical protein [Eubacterium xylanophilum]|uniref:hypothetical protein n=1 Tax=Eubacterium xylanophilum TaxID=39497 RepID=UPI00047E0FB6|nr:hypothetical protein [Eubacterium xylanophilum]